jgi:DNA-binding transcriptional regulator YdaS (Cro superfamily)
MATKQVVALRRAIEKLGGQSALARACGVKQGHVWHWLNKSRRAPADYVLTIEAATGGGVTRHELRPDIFGEPATARPEKVPAKSVTRLPGLKTAAPKTFLNAHILAQIVALETHQHRAIREAMLGRSGATDHLARLDAEIAALRTMLRTRSKPSR